MTWVWMSTFSTPRKILIYKLLVVRQTDYKIGNCAKEVSPRRFKFALLWCFRRSLISIVLASITYAPWTRSPGVHCLAISGIGDGFSDVGASTLLPARRPPCPQKQGVMANPGNLIRCSMNLDFKMHHISVPSPEVMIRFLPNWKKVIQFAPVTSARVQSRTDNYRKGRCIKLL